MRLVVISHKETWPDSSSPSGYVTTGGFSFQMTALSELFDQTTVMVPIRNSPLPGGAGHLNGHHFQVYPLQEPTGTGLHRKVALLTWLPRNLPQIWGAIRHADAVHTPVPGDIGMIGLLIALVQHKPLFVRHCGTWGEPATVSDRFLFWLLERIAGGRNVVLATGGGDTPPSRKNHNIRWIFSTTLSEAELASIPIARPWKRGETLRLVFVGRLSREKNAISLIEALPLVLRNYPAVHLAIVGDGEAREELVKKATELNLTDRVVFHGNLAHEEVLRILSESHLFVFPTRVKEGFPKAVLEALACGLPVIATDVSVIPYLIRDCGEVLTDTCPQTVAKTILELISDEERLIKISASARKKAQGYSIECWQDEIASHLKSAWSKWQ